MPVVTPTPQPRDAAPWHHLAPGKSDVLRVQAVRYGVVAVVALAVDVTLLVALTEFVGLHYLVSAALSFLGGLVTNYLLSVTWVFHHRSVNNGWVEFGVFAGIGLLGLGMLEVMMWLLTDKVGMAYLISKAVATIVVFSWNFLARRFFLFRPPAETPSRLAHAD